MKKLILTTSLSLAILGLTGCNGSDSSSSIESSSVQSDTTETISVSGTASAPNGEIAMFQEKGFFEFTLLSTAHAAVLGLEPVVNAKVDLIRIDDEGVQVGEIIATTYTSITGGYTLSLPSGTDLSGSLVARITGTNSKTLRAQIIDEEVDISPISEFILAKFIASETDLDNLDVDSVLKLRGQIEEFDLTAGVSMEATLSLLDSELGSFVNNQIDAIDSTPSSAVSLSGTYRGVNLEFALHDNDAEGGATYGLSSWQEHLVYVGKSNGEIDATFNYGYGVWEYVSGDESSSSALPITHNIEVEEDEFSFSLILSEDNTISGESPFEEEIDGDFGWRTPPSVHLLQKVHDNDLIFNTETRASVRYAVTNNALDPDDKLGDELMSSINVYAKQPTNMQDSDLTGTFGLVYIESGFTNHPLMGVMTSKNTLSFNGDGTVQKSSSEGVTILRSDSEEALSGAVTEQPESFTIEIAEDGEVEMLNGEVVDGFINDNFNFMALIGAENEPGELVQHSLALAVKLGDEALTFTGKQYRLMFLNTAFGDNGINHYSSNYRTILSWSDETTGDVALDTSEIHLDSLTSVEAQFSQFSGESSSITNTATTDQVTTITMSGGEGEFTLQGYFNETGSLGVFNSAYSDEITTPASEIGIAVLVEIN